VKVLPWKTLVIVDEGKGNQVEFDKIDGDVKADQNNPVYPYWKKIPPGWDYPAACGSGIGGKGGWAASVDRQKGFDFLETLMVETASTAASQCAGCLSVGCNNQSKWGVWGV
jgi:hypothetical protein